MYGERIFTQKRISRTGDGAGGKVETPITIATVTGRAHFYQRRSQAELEREPGRQVRQEKVVIFDDPDMDILAKDLLVDEVASETWRVKHVRHYDYQTQADTELIS